MTIDSRHKETLSEIMETVRTVYHAMNGIPPMVFMTGSDDTRFTFPILTFAERAYIESCSAIKKFAHGCKAEMAVTLSQGRYLDVPPGVLVLMTVEDQFRFSKEVLFVRYETRDSRHMLHYPILRNGEEVALGDPVEVDPDIKPAIFFNIF